MNLEKLKKEFPDVDPLVIEEAYEKVQMILQAIAPPLMEALQPIVEVLSQLIEPMYDGVLEFLRSLPEVRIREWFEQFKYHRRGL